MNFLQIRKYIIRGLITVLPLVITLGIVFLLFKWMGTLTKPFILPLARIFLSTEHIMSLVNIVSFFLTLVVIYATGVLVNNILSRNMLANIESLVYDVPVLKTIYDAARKLTQYFFTTSQSKRNIVLIQYPRKGVYSLGFLTAESAAADPGMACVFVPRTPNPIEGLMVMVPREDIILLDMKFEAAVNLIVSGGIIQPATSYKVSAGA